MILLVAPMGPLIRSHRLGAVEVDLHHLHIEVKEGSPGTPAREAHMRSTMVANGAVAMEQEGSPRSKRIFLWFLPCPGPAAKAA